MFFSISSREDSRFFEHTCLGSHVVSHDPGWKFYELNDCKILFKGYIDDASIEQVIEAKTPTYTGNFTAIVVDYNDNLLLTHSKERCFPLVRNKDQITNLEYTLNDKNFRTIYPDEYINGDEIVEYTPYDYSQSTYTESSGIEELSRILIEKTNYLRDKHIEIFLSGGCDTTTLYSLIRNQNISHSVIPGMQITFDEFICNNLQHIYNNLEHWAYYGIHHFNRPAIIVSGTPGDEFFMRGPDTLPYWLAWHNIDVNKILNKNSYHYEYFNKDKNIKKFSEIKHEEITDVCPTIDDLNKFILQINSNDYQHWHLCNTVTWTPFRDLRITNIILNMPFDTIIKQIADAYINKTLIKQFDFDVLKYMSTYKNDVSWKTIYEAIKIN